MKRPIIGISCTQVQYVTEGDQFWGTSADGIHEFYAKSVIEAGGLPMLLPITLNDDVINQMIGAIDGLLLTGGPDLDPLLYGEAPHRNLGFVYYDRDAFDMRLVKAAVNANIPILGICRGCQVINVAFGGTLYQDLPSQCEGVHAHSLNSDPKTPGHYVDIVQDSLLASIYGETACVNSLHHQAVKDVAPDFFVAAKAKDGVIECIQHKERFILGVQWHPEWLSRLDDKALKIFEAFVEAAK